MNESRIPTLTEQFKQALNMTKKEFQQGPSVLQSANHLGLGGPVLASPGYSSSTYVAPSHQPSYQPAYQPAYQPSHTNLIGNAYSPVVSSAPPLPYGGVANYPSTPMYADMDGGQGFGSAGEEGSGLGSFFSNYGKWIFLVVLLIGGLVIFYFWRQRKWAKEEDKEKEKFGNRPLRQTPSANERGNNAANDMCLASGICLSPPMDTLSDARRGNAGQPSAHETSSSFPLLAASASGPLPPGVASLSAPLTQASRPQQGAPLPSSLPTFSVAQPRINMRDNEQGLSVRGAEYTNPNFITSMRPVSTRIDQERGNVLPAPPSQLAQPLQGSSQPMSNPANNANNTNAAAQQQQAQQQQAQQQQAQQQQAQLQQQIYQYQQQLQQMQQLLQQQNQQGSSSSSLPGTLPVPPPMVQTAPSFPSASADQASSTTFSPPISSDPTATPISIQQPAQLNQPAQAPPIDPYFTPVSQ